MSFLPIEPYLIELIVRMDAEHVSLIIAGGLGIYIKRRWVQAQVEAGDRTNLFDSLPDARATDDIDALVTSRAPTISCSRSRWPMVAIARSSSICSRRSPKIQGSRSTSRWNPASCVDWAPMTTKPPHPRRSFTHSPRPKRSPSMRNRCKAVTEIFAAPERSGCKTITTNNRDAELARFSDVISELFLGPGV